MAKITRTEKGGLDTDGDLKDDVLFSVIPEQRPFHHANGATFQVQVENLREVSIDMWKKVRDIAGNEEYEKMDKTIDPGERKTIESVMLIDGVEPHPGVPKRIKTQVQYRVAIGDKRYKKEFDIEADCFDP